MKKFDILRAWKDEDYFLSLNETERAALPAHPSGLIQLADEELRSIAGGSESSIEACTVPRGYCSKSACTIGLMCSDTTAVDCV
jgi:mersacidin/lichenicidin family type 2 lantibiotic